MVSPALAHLRTVLGLCLALTAVLLVAPASLGPTGHGLARLLARAFSTLGRHHLQLALLLEHLVPVVLASSLLLPAGLLLPRPHATGVRRPELLPLGLGCLLLLEPLVHLALLGLLAISPWLGTSDLVLPAPTAPTPGWHMLMVFTVLAVLAPMVEEFFFRMRLLPWLRQRFGTFSAVTLSALAFACAHGEPRQALVALPVGLLLGILRVRGASWLVLAIVHQAHNAIFILAGIGVISDPWISVALSGAGLACLLLASCWPGRCGWLPPWPGTLAVLVLAATLAVLQPVLQGVQERCWLRAVHRVILDPRVAAPRLLHRIDELQRAGRLEQHRREQLVTLLTADLDSHPIPGDPDEIQWILALLAPASVAAEAEEQAASAFERLASCPLHLPQHDQAALLLARAHPDLFASAAIDLPEGLVRWMPLPGSAAAFQEQIERSAPRDRQRLLAGFERCFPGLVADVARPPWSASSDPGRSAVPGAGTPMPLSASRGCRQSSGPARTTRPSTTSTLLPGQRSARRGSGDSRRRQRHRAGEQPIDQGRRQGGRPPGLSAEAGQRLLAGFERCFPGLVADVMLALPAGQVTLVDRLFLRRHYLDAAERIARLPPEQAAAWTVSATAPASGASDAPVAH